jgi:hypothetical protein
MRKINLRQAHVVKAVAGRDRKPRKTPDRLQLWKGGSRTLKHSASYFELLSGNGIQQRKEADRMHSVA